MTGKERIFHFQPQMAHINRQISQDEDGWVGDERLKRQMNRLRDEKIMGARDFRAQKENGRRSSVGTELAKHLENHDFKQKKTYRTSPADMLPPVRRYAMTCKREDIIIRYSTFPSSRCILKIELLITV